MDSKVETVKIKRPDVPGGHVVINKSDLKPTDRIYKERKRKAKDED